ncbi:MAG: sugar kinase [Fibrobacteres bacterium]|nr:sugar kinase [Fibrobacterota bacterium]
MPLLIVGSVGIDDIITEEGSAKGVLGGSSSYAAVAAGLFDRVRLVGVVGNDFPKKYVELYKKKNIDLAGLETANGKTFRWTGKYAKEFKTRDTLEINLNVFADFRPKIPAQYKDSPYVLLANIDPDLQHMVLDQIKKPKFVAVDTMDLWINIKRDRVAALLKRVDLIVMNDEEAALYTGKNNLISAGKELLKSGVKYAIIKKGSHGAILFSKNSIFQIPAYPLEKVVDPTGAGDSFIGGVMGYAAAKKRSDEASIRRGIVYGTVAASYNVEAFSLEKLKTVSKADVEKRFKFIASMTKF